HGQGAHHLLPPGLLGLVARPVETATAISLDLLRGAHRDDRARNRVAPVLESHERARLVAPRAQVLGHQHAEDALRPGGVAVVVAPWPGAEDHAGAAHPPAPRRGILEGAVLPA